MASAFRQLEARRVRRAFLAFLLVPAAASVVAAVADVIGAEASLLVQTSAILAILALLVDITLELAFQRRHEVQAFPNDDDALPFTVAHIAQGRPGAVDCIEYSALGAMPVLAKLGEVGSTRSIRLLVADPDAAISDYQRDFRLAEGMRMLAYRIPSELARAVGLEVRCYAEPASLRGRMFDGELVMAGWYTYDDRGLAKDGGAQIAGGSNALVCADTKTVVGSHLVATFSRTFENIWREARPAADAWAPYHSKLSHLPPAEWFHAVEPAGARARKGRR
jgi:hypothetical protein